MRTDLIGPPERFVFDRAPLLVYWEATRACDLACVHCRAEAIPTPHPLELSTAEAEVLFGQIAQFDSDPPPHLVITGGDPLHRLDLFNLIAFGKRLGLSISVTPAGTQRLTYEVIRRFKEAGVSNLALSLDGSDASKHDAVRGVDGSFRWTLEAVPAALAQGVPLQINTIVTADTVDDLPRIFEVLQSLRISRWALFFLIPTGRGRTLAEVTPWQSERVLGWLWGLMETRQARFPIKTTEAHHFRRIAFRRMRARAATAESILNSPVGRGFGVRDGNGVVFVSHIGQVYPSGFLPLGGGNIRWKSLPAIYRHDDLFRRLRNVGCLRGKCGVCEFRAICGGSRARAYATSGDPMQSDPLCSYQPGGPLQNPTTGSSPAIA